MALKSLIIKSKGKEITIEEGFSIQFLFNGVRETPHIFDGGTSAFIENLYEQFSNLPEFEVVKIEKPVIA